MAPVKLGYWSVRGVSSVIFQSFFKISFWFLKTVWTFRVKESVKDKFSSGTALGDLTIHFYNGALWWWHCKFAPTTKAIPI